MVIAQSLSWRPVSERKTSSRSTRPDEMRCTAWPRAASHEQQRRRGAAEVGDAGMQAGPVLARPAIRGLAAERDQVDRAVDLELERLDRGQALVQALQRVAGDDLAVVHDDDAVAQPLGLFHVVRRVEQRLAAVAQRLEVVEDGVAALRVDADRRLVEDQHVGIVDQRGGDVEAPLHAAAEELRLVAGAIGEADQLQRRVDALAQQRAGQAVERAEELEVGGGAEVLVDRELLRHDADAALGVGRVLGQLERGSRRCRRRPAAGRRRPGRTASPRSSTCRRRSARAGRRSRRRRRSSDRSATTCAVAVRFAKTLGFEHRVLPAERARL